MIQNNRGEIIVIVTMTIIKEKVVKIEASTRFTILEGLKHTNNDFIGSFIPDC